MVGGITDENYKLLPSFDYNFKLCAFGEEWIDHRDNSASPVNLNTFQGRKGTQEGCELRMVFRFYSPRKKDKLLFFDGKKRVPFHELCLDRGGLVELLETGSFTCSIFRVEIVQVINCKKPGRQKDNIIYNIAPSLAPRAVAQRF